MEQTELQRAAEQFIALAVRGNSEQAAQQIAVTLTCEHRTHQQMFMGVLKQVIRLYADAGHDLRNEAAVEWSKEVAQLSSYSGIRFPYI